MTRLLPRTILGQLIAGTVLVQTVLLALFLSLTVRHELEQNDVTSMQRLQNQTQLLARLVQHPLEMRDAEQTQSLVEAVRASPVISSARITDLQGNTLALSPATAGGLDQYEQPQIRQPFAYHGFRGENGETEGVAPVISSEGRTIALAWIEMDPAILHRQPISLVKNAMQYALLAILANLLLVVVLARSISRPLRLLVAGTQELAHDPEYSSKFPLPVTTFNEVGDLTHSFNTTVLELRQQRAGLRETLAMLDSMLATAPVGFAFYDRELRFVRVNQYLANMDVSPILQHVGRHVRDVAPAGLAPMIEAGIEKVFATGEPLLEVDMDGESPQQPGVPCSWTISFYPVYEADEIRWVGAVVIETTQRRQAEEAMRKTEKLAAAGRLAASIAHEINNPLEAVTNLLYLLKTQPSLDAEARDYAEAAQRELGRVAQITQQTLRFYRQSTQPTSAKLGEILDSVLLLYHARIESTRVEVVCDYAETRELMAFGGEMRQLFANLIGNAADAMPNGGRLLLRVRTGHWWNGEEAVVGVRVTVADTGCGMPEEVRRRIFEPFFTTKEATGTGLGLWVSEEIVNKHGGHISVRSRTEEPSGTVFTIFFPYEGVVLTRVN
jgi:nitrogen-specific signal transduction histidine kinase/HAMP domain-containing protein